jgi:hypothetical protein
MKMDWRPLGYWPVYKDGKLTWEKDSDKDVNSVCREIPHAS